MRESALNILKAARDKIADPLRWGKGRRNFERPMDTCCTAEAVYDAAPLAYAEHEKAIRALYNAAGLEWKGRFHLTHWNDAPERTHAEVIATFNLAIALERNMPRAR